MPLKTTDILTLNPACALKRLEHPCLYNKETDELYELNEEAFAFLAGVAQGGRYGTADEEFVDYCLEEGILVAGGVPVSRTVPRETASAPSLRYLEVQLTTACNLRCRHCYIAGMPQSTFLYPPCGGCWTSLPP